MAELGTVTVTGSKYPGVVSSDDYYLAKLNIITQDNQKFDIKPLLLELSYFEDIFRGATTGHILINDSIGFITNLSLNGQEKIELVYKKSQKTEDELNKTFRLIRVGERTRTNFSTETYSLHFCSEYLIRSEMRKVSKSYKDKVISDIVLDILKEYMGVPELNCSVEQTDGIFSFIMPYKKPIEAINFLANYSRPAGVENNLNYDFVFFENKDSFVFSSLQTLYKKPVYNRYSYSSKNYLTPSSKVELDRSIRGIKAFSFLDTFDSLYGITTGAFASKTISIDPLTRQYYVTNYDYNTYFNNSKHLNKYPVTDFNNEIYKSGNEAVLKVLTTNKNQEKALGISDKPGAVGHDMYVEDRVRYRTAQMALSQYTRMKLTLPGDPGLTVGETIFVEIPLMSENQKGGLDSYASGKYLITAVRQVIDANMEYETVMEVTKESTAKSVSLSTFNNAPLP